MDCNSTATEADCSDTTGNPHATLGSHTVLGQTRPPIELTCPLSHPTFGSCRMDCKSSKTAWDRSDTTGMHARHHSMLGQTRPLFALMCQCCSLSCVVLETGCEGRTTHMHVLRHGAHACTWSDSVPSNMTTVLRICRRCPRTFRSWDMDCNSTTTEADCSDATGNPRATLGSHTELGQTTADLADVSTLFSDFRVM